jgi:hypothetical protein
MPGKPWDEANVKANILAIGSIMRGNRLSVLQDGTKASQMDLSFGADAYALLRDVFRVETSFMGKARRRKRGEEITDPNQYSIPLNYLFTEAVLQHRSGHMSNITKQDLERAIQGLKNLKNSYKGSAKQELERIISGVELSIRLKGGLTKRTGLIKLDGTGKTLNLMSMTKMKGIKNKYYEQLDLTRNVGAITEHESSPAELTAIYGYNTRSREASTTLPTMTHKKYKRKKLGLCDAFYGDCGRFICFLNDHDTPLPIPALNAGVSRAKLAPEINKIFQAIGQDEAMLFLLSQLISQAGIPAITAFLERGFMNHYTPQIRGLFFRKHGGNKFQFHTSGNYIKKFYIDTGNFVKLTFVVELTAGHGVVAYYEDGRVYGEIDKSLKTVVNLSMLKFTYVTYLQRQDDSIRWKLQSMNLQYAQ